MVRGGKSPQKKAPKGTVVVESERGRLRIRLPRHLYGGKLKRFSCQLPDTPENRKLAEAKAKQIEADIRFERFDPTLNRYRAPTFEPPPSQKPTSLLTLWEQYAKARSPILASSSRKIFRATSNKLKECPHKSIEKAAQIKTWLLENGTPEAARRTLQQLNACGNWAVEQGIIENNPFAKLQRLKKKAHSQVDPFTPSEREAILQAFEESDISRYYLPLVRFLFLTGCRPSEAVALRWQDVDPERSKITFSSAIVEGERKTTKTEGLRVFPVNPPLLALLDSLPRAAAGAPLFPAPGGGAIDWHNFGNRVWKPIVSKLPFRYRTPYCCRHTFITECLRAKVSVKQIASWVGNSPEVILKHYAGLTGEDVPEF